MRFRFRLDSLLRIRTLREDLERERLLVSQFQMDRSRQTVWERSRVHSETRQGFLDRERMLSGSELHYLQSCLSNQKSSLRLAETELREQEESCTEQRKRYESAHQNAEVLRRLRERRWQSFCEELRRDEQKQMDELFRLSPKADTRQPLPSK